MKNEENSTAAGFSEAEINDRIRAILRYMLKHNDRHAEQLSDLCPYLDEDLQKKMRYAIGAFETATAELAEILDILNTTEFSEDRSGKKEAAETVPDAGTLPEGTGHVHVHDPKEKRRQVSRLSRVIGHLEYVKRMLEADEDCANVLIQISASKSALNGLGKQIINEHIAHCITHAVEEGDTAALEEFQKAIEKYI